MSEIDYYLITVYVIQNVCLLRSFVFLLLLLFLFNPITLIYIYSVINCKREMGTCVHDDTTIWVNHNFVVAQNSKRKYLGQNQLMREKNFNWFTACAYCVCQCDMQKMSGARTRLSGISGIWWCGMCHCIAVWSGTYHHIYIDYLSPVFTEN